MSRWIKSMAPRSATEPHRVSTPLELFFDLVFVVAVNFAASALHHDISEDHIRHGILSFIPVFFAIWIAWLNFTWFASAYDVDDVPYRIMVLIQMTGALVLAAGIPRAFAEQDLKIVVAGYVIMRLALVGQWVRAGYSDPERRPTALRYAIGVTLLQAGWIWFGFVKESFSWKVFGVLAALELFVPIWAERKAPTTWHPHHIAERYGLFTIIVLGEAVLGTAIAIQSVVDTRTFDGERAAIAVGSIVSLYMLWWIYFDYDAHEILTRLRNTFAWGYGHVFLWGGIAATGAGIAVCIDYATGHSSLTQTQAQLAMAIPLAVFLVSLWAFHDLTEALSSLRRLATPIAALLVVGTAWFPYAPVWMAFVLIVLAIVREFGHEHAKATAH
ncbi:MAG: low temperature requirement protein A [Thermomicrobiales bacterium]|nr:MAG: low temperature requirement protein A [Thermomicrobiales bacterium]